MLASSLLQGALLLLSFAESVVTYEPAWISRPAHFDSSTPIPNHYIVQYHADVDADTKRFHETAIHRSTISSGPYRGLIKKFNFGAFSGYHGELEPTQVQHLRQSGLIKSVYPDYHVRIASPLRHLRSQRPPSNAQPPFTNKTHTNLNPTHNHESTTPIPASGPNLITTTPSTSWNLARISHRSPSHSSYITEKPSVTVYIIDSGIQLNHTQFDPNLVHFGANFSPENTTLDTMGHGTHVAGIIAGRTTGIFPRARLVALKVFSERGGGSWSAILGAIEWAVADTTKRNGAGRSVINMSLGGGLFPPINDAIKAATEAGITVVVAAGNQGVDLSGMSPASSEDVIAVGSIGQGDRRSGFSNYGPGLSVFAPGEGVVSSFIGEGTDKTVALSGTSMAAPHVAGLAAYFMEVYGPHTPRQMRERIEGLATQGKVEDPGEGSPNRIAFNGNILEMAP